MNKTLTFLILIILGFQSSAQDYEKRIDGFLSTESGKLKIPNLEVSVVNSDGIIFSRSYGVKSSDSELFYLGSVSKSLTALGVLKLVEGKKLDFEDKLSDIIPEINYNEHAGEITVRHLLNHTSGISKISGFDNLPKLSELSGSRFSLTIMEMPGNKHEYSNLNYSLLGLVIERISRMPFSEFMSSGVFGPLQMNSGRIYPGRQSNGEIVTQYQYWGPFPVKSKQVDYHETAVPAGFILSNVADMSNYLSMILANGEFKKEKVIDPKLLSEMLTPWDSSEFGYGMGWKKGMYNQKIIYQHLGSTATSYSAIFIVPEKNMGFTVLTNTNSLSYTENIAEGILNILTDGEVNKGSGNEFYFRLGVLLAILLILVNLMVKVFRYFKSGQVVELKKNYISIGINAVIFIAVVIVFPHIANVPLMTFLKLQPDIGTLIILVVISPLLNNIFKLVHFYNFTSKKSTGS